MSKLIIMLLALFAMKAWGTVTVQNFSCPDHFEGRVVELIDGFYVSGIEKQKVIFEVDEVLKGSEKLKQVIEILKNGPFDFVIGDSYSVHLKQGKVCFIERI